MSAAPGWREREAAQLEFLAGELRKALVEAENTEAILELRGDRAGLTTTRAFLAALRSQISEMTANARELRADPPVAVLPVSLTTRRLQR